MNVNLRTSADDREYEGVCPECYEHTTAGDSCCGAGAFVEGSHVSDETVMEREEFPTVCIKLLEDAQEEKASALKTALFNAGINSMMFSGNMNTWNVNIFVEVNQLSQYKDNE